MLRRRFIAAAVTAMLAGCATGTMPVDSFEAPEADVAGRRTFAWKGGEFGAPSATVDPALVEHARQDLRTAVTAELVRKGYVETADAAAADMLVSYQVAGQRRYVISDERRIGAPSPNEMMTPGGRDLPPASAVPREQTVREGSVLIFVDDARSGRLIWRGLAEAEIRVSSSEAAVHSAVEMARQVAATFPARRTGG